MQYTLLPRRVHKLLAPRARNRVKRPKKWRRDRVQILSKTLSYSRHVDRMRGVVPCWCDSAWVGSCGSVVRLSVFLSDCSGHVQDTVYWQEKSACIVPFHSRKECLHCAFSFKKRGAPPTKSKRLLCETHTEPPPLTPVHRTHTSR